MPLYLRLLLYARDCSARIWTAVPLWDRRPRSMGPNLLVLTHEPQHSIFEMRILGLLDVSRSLDNYLLGQIPYMLTGLR